MSMDKQTTAALIALEAAVLGSILRDANTLTDLPRLEPEDFHGLQHRAVFTAMRNLESRGTPIDTLTVQAEVAKWQGHSDNIDEGFLGLLLLNVPTSENALEYAKQVREASLSRRVVDALDRVMRQFDREALTGGELLTEALAVLSKIDADQPDTAQPIAALVQRRLRQLEQIAEDRRNGVASITGFPTGIAGLDEKIGGIQAGIVSIVGARPAMGKSSLGLAIADASSAAGHGVHLFSMEDTEESYADRTLSRTSDVPAETMRNSTLNRGQCDQIARAIGGLRTRKWIVDSRSGIPADEIIRSVRRHRRANATKVVIVDYIQLVKRTNPRQSTHEHLTDAVTLLADAAKQDRMAYVVMCQLNRGLESRPDKRPQLADLRESGSLEERAKCVIGLYRGSYYGKPTKGVDFDPQWDGHARPPTEDEFERQVQLLVLKNSNGRTGRVWGTWSGPTTKLS